MAASNALGYAARQRSTRARAAIMIQVRNCIRFRVSKKRRRFGQLKIHSAKFLARINARLMNDGVFEEYLSRNIL